MGFFVYILACADGSFYVGHTDDIDNRIALHQSGQIPGFTASRLPVALVYSNQFTTRDDAFAAERKLKGWSRAKKQALIRGDWAEIKRLSKRRSGKT